jgi:hypothetical protein
MRVAPVTVLPPPDTALGRLVKIERADKAAVMVTYLSAAAANGLGHETRSRIARKGKTFLTLTFEGKVRGEPKVWLSGANGHTYKDWFSNPTKSALQVSFEIPADAAGLLLHIGKKTYEVEPTARETTDLAEAR